MAHSIESRVPYLDHRVVEMAFGIPISWKVGEGQRKRLLREAARPLLPPVVADRADKRGVIFTPRWLDLRSHGAGIEEVIGSARLRDCPYLDGAAVRKFVRSYMDGSHDDAHGVWRLYTAGLWLDRFSPSAA